MIQCLDIRINSEYERSYWVCSSYGVFRHHMKQRRGAIIQSLITISEHEEQPADGLLP